MQKHKKKLRFNDLSNPFQRFRSQTGVTQLELAKNLGLRQSTISGYEAGDVPDPPVAKRFIDLAKKHRIRMDFNELYAGLK